MRMFAKWNNNRMKCSFEKATVIDIMLFVGQIIENGAEAVGFLTPEQMAKMALKAFEVNKESSSDAERVIFLAKLNALHEHYKSKNSAEEKKTND